VQYIILLILFLCITINYLLFTGSQRRSILNHDELSNALKEKFGEDFASVSLEGTSVSFQYLLFSRAQIVIAQHGESFELYSLIF
jgi:hypothetical protein